jgi:hypothetical protein
MPLLAREVIHPWISRKRRMRALGILLGASLVVGMVTQIVRPIRAMSKPQVARATARIYADYAYPQWRSTHHALCPQSLDELNEFMNNKDIKDPWGTPYYFACGPLAVPHNATGIWVMSAGEDGRFGTADDVRSDR